MEICLPSLGHAVEIGYRIEATGWGSEVIRKQDRVFPVPDPELKKGRKYLVGYVSVMRKQEGIDLLLRSAREASLYAKPNDIVDLAEKIVELLDDPDRRARMGEFGRRCVENELEWAYEAPKLLAAYDELFLKGL